MNEEKELTTLEVQNLIYERRKKLFEMKKGDDKIMLIKVEKHIWLGDILAILLFLLSVHWDVWSKIDNVSQILLGFAFIILFLRPHTYSFKEEKKMEKDE